jgi:hypothetical protein
VIFGAPAPPLAGPNASAILTRLRRKPCPKISFLSSVTAVGTTPFKCLGIQGWKDYGLNAAARGVVVQHRISSDGLMTVDLRLLSLAVDQVAIPILGPRYIRLEIYLGKVSVNRSLLRQPGTIIRADGKLVWDTDGWFEIHPQKSGDVRPDPAVHQP